MTVCIVWGGCDKNNIFYGGGAGNNTSFPWLKKWNGVSSEIIEMPPDTGHPITDILVISPNDVWLDSRSTKIYHYNGADIETYQMNPALWGGKLFKKNGSMFFYAHEDSDTNVFLNMYIFKGVEWNLQSIKRAEIEHFIFPPITFVETFGNFVMAPHPDRIDEFDGISWHTKAATPTFESCSIAGLSSNNFLSMGVPKDICICMKAFYFTGDKWLYQSDVPYPETGFWGFPVFLTYCNDKFYGYYYLLDNVQHNYFLVGKIKE